MAKGLTKVVDVFTLGSASRAERGAAKKGRIAAEQVKAADTARIASEEKAQADLKAKDEENKKKLATGNAESRRSAISNYLAEEGGQTSRRRFLVGAK